MSKIRTATLIDDEIERLEAELDLTTKGYRNAMPGTREGDGAAYERRTKAIRRELDKLESTRSAHAAARSAVMRSGVTLLSSALERPKR